MLRCWNRYAWAGLFRCYSYRDEDRFEDIYLVTHVGHCIVYA